VLTNWPHPGQRPKRWKNSVSQLVQRIVAGELSMTDGMKSGVLSTLSRDAQKRQDDGEYYLGHFEILLTEMQPGGARLQCLREN